ncbi:MAG: hypothetical protein KA185_03280 [Vitreoscilla sp.]|nr:hypothetical protein [Vitreoscilla sp.]
MNEIYLRIADSFCTRGLMETTGAELILSLVAGQARPKLVALMQATVVNVAT